MGVGRSNMLLVSCWSPVQLVVGCVCCLKRGDKATSSRHLSLVSLVPRLLPVFLSHTVQYAINKRLGRSLGTSGYSKH